MINLAKQSPRIENGILKWYWWDTFELDFEFNFTDEDGNPIPEDETESLTLTIYNQVFDEVLSTTSNHSHTVSIAIDDTNTKLFKRGTYYYKVRRNSWYITTIIQENEIIVE